MPSNEEIRRAMVQQGYDPAEIDRMLYGGPVGDALAPVEDGNVSRREIVGHGGARLEIDGLRKEGFDAMADSIDQADMATFLESFAGTPEQLEQILGSIRTDYAESRFDVAASMTQALSDVRSARDQSGLSKFVAGLLGSDVAQLAIGGAEVLGRPQQTLYGLLSGEGTAAFQRLVPKVVLYDDSEGGLVETTPSQAVWNALTSGRDEWDVNMDAVRQANMEYADKSLLEFQDVVDSWIGEETADEIYHSLHEQGAFGKVKMAGLATGMAAAEIFLDPLIILDGVAVKGVQAARTLGTTAQQARATAKYARQTNRLTDLTEAAGKAETHLKAMHQQHQIERNPTSMARLAQAERNYAERVDALLAQQTPGDFERVYTGPVRGNPEVLATREVMHLPFEIVAESPTRFNTVERAARVVDEIDDLLERSKQDLAKLQAPDSPATAEQVRAFEKEIDRLARTRQRTITDPESIPDVIPFEGTFLRTRTVDEINAIRKADRMASLDRPTVDMQPRPEEAMQTSLLDDAPMAARLAEGPDDAEYAAEGLARLVDGADADEIGVPSTLTPEYSAKSDGRQILNVNEGLVDLDKAQITLREMRDKATRDQHKVYDKALREMKSAQRKGEDVKFDESWLPAPRKNIEDAMWDSWKAEYGASFGDRIAQSMAPGSWRLKFNAPLRKPFMFLREPMRVLEEMDPGVSWPVLRNAMNNAEAENSRLMAVFDDAFQQYGAITKQEATAAHRVSVTDPKAYRKVNKDASAELFDLMEIPRNTEMWDEALNALTPQQRKAVLTIREELDRIAEKLGFTGTDRFVEGYMPHAFDDNWFTKGGMPPEMRGLSRNGNIFLAHMLRRNGEDGFIKDAVGLLDLYARGVSRKLYMEPALETFTRRATEISRQRGNSWYRSYADLTLSQLKGEPSLAGRLLDHVGGSLAVSTGKHYVPGQISRRLMMVPSLTYAAVLGANRRYPVMAISTALATTGAKYGMFRTLKGMFQMATPEGQALWRAAGGGDQWKRIFEHAGDLERNIDRFTETMSGIRVLTPSIRDSENFIRGMTFFASVDEQLTAAGFRTWADAKNANFESKILFDAMRSTEEVNHFFGVGAKPPIFSKISKSGSAAATQFLSFGPKQTEMLLQLAGENPGNLVRYMMLSGWMTRIAAQDMGLDLSDYLGVGYLRNQGTRDLTTPAVEFIGNSVGMAARTLDFMNGNATEDELDKSINTWIKSGENMIPLMNAARSVAKSVEAGVTGEQAIPGQGRPRPVDFTITGEGKGKRGELLGSVLGIRTVKERAAQESRRQVRNLLGKVTHERRVLVERAFRMSKDGDSAGFNQQVQRLAELGVPFGDVADGVRTRHEIQTLYWHHQILKRNPKISHRILPILEGYGILGDDNE